MKIKFECPRCVTAFEKEEQVITRRSFLDRSTSYLVRCPSCFYMFEVPRDHVDKQVNDNLNKLSKGGR